MKRAYFRKTMVLACSLAFTLMQLSAAQAKTRAPGASSFARMDRFEAKFAQKVRKATIGFQKMMPTRFAQKIVQQEVKVWKSTGCSERDALRQVSGSALGQMVKNSWRATPFAIGFNGLEAVIVTNEAVKTKSAEYFPKKYVQKLGDYAKKHPIKSSWNTFRLAITPVLARTSVPGVAINAVANGGHALFHGFRHVAAEKLINQQVAGQ